MNWAAFVGADDLPQEAAHTLGHLALSLNHTFA